MRYASVILFLSVFVLSAGCDSDDGPGPGDPTDSTISFILNGGSWSNTAIELRDNARGLWLTQSNGRLMAVLDGLASVGGTATRRIVATITIPASNPGTHPWIDPKGAVLSASGLFLDIYEQDGSVQSYQAVQGSTVLGVFRAVGEQTEGNFEGSLRSSIDGGIITVSNGTFSLTRISNL